MRRPQPPVPKCWKPCFPISPSIMAIPAPSTAWAARRGRRWRRRAGRWRRRWARSPGDLFHRLRHRERQLGHPRRGLRPQEARATTSSPRRSSITPSCTPASSWKRRALRSPICRWTNTVWCSLEELGKGAPPGDDPRFHHGPPTTKSAPSSPSRETVQNRQSARCAVPHRRGAGRWASCPST